MHELYEIIGVGGMFHDDLVKYWKQGNKPKEAFAILQFVYRHEPAKAGIIPSLKKIKSLYKHLHDTKRSKIQV